MRRRPGWLRSGRLAPRGLVARAQVEVTFQDEPFALVPIHTIDGDRIAAELTKKQLDCIAAEQNQTKFEIAQ